MVGIRTRSFSPKHRGVNWGQACDFCDFGFDSPRAPLFQQPVVMENVEL